jgi:hypothetical protein
MSKGNQIHLPDPDLAQDFEDLSKKSKSHVPYEMEQYKRLLGRFAAMHPLPATQIQSS